MDDSTPTHVTFPGRVLFITDDPADVRAQLDGVDLPWPHDKPLRDDISTDELTPAHACFHYDEVLGEFALVGLRGGHVRRGDIAAGGFSVLVSGKSKGCGSSRETAPFAELAAGIKLVIAHSFEKIYLQNCQNIGLLTSTRFDLIPRILAGESLPRSLFSDGLDPIAREVVEHGGLLAHSVARLAGKHRPIPPSCAPRPMTLAEKIIARRVVTDASTGAVGVPHVAPGDAAFVRTDLRFTHEYVTPMAEAMFMRGFGADARVTEPQSALAFRDHLTFIDAVIPAGKLLDKAAGLAVTQRDFARRQGIQLIDERDDGGSEAICHAHIVENVAVPGQLIVGSDSHTCTAGVLGAFAFGAGATDLANAWRTNDIRVKVPKTIRVDLEGALAPDATAKDAVLTLLATDAVRAGDAIGSVLEFGGPGLASLDLDERATLTNMAVEAGAFTGLMVFDDAARQAVAAIRGVTPEQIGGDVLHPDADAVYAGRISLDLAQIQPMVATPGDPKNGRPITALSDRVPIDIAYGGSCTGGKATDMDLYARVLQSAADAGRTVAPGVKLYVQFGSQRVREYARSRGYIELFESVGATLINPSCGACINAGPGASRDASQVTVSAINRNYAGRSGPGSVYLASPLVVAASAINGYISGPHVEGL